MSKTLIAVLITGLLVGGGTYWYAKNTTTPNTISSGTVQSNTNLKYKYLSDSDFYSGHRNPGFDFEIPATWSVFIHTPDEPGTLPKEGIAPEGKIGDESFLIIGEKNISLNGCSEPCRNKQIYFSASSSQIANQIIEADKKTDDTGTWTKENVGGIVADVHTYSIDGSKTYYLALDNSKSPYYGTLTIISDFNNNDVSQKEFQHLIETFKITQ